MNRYELNSRKILIKLVCAGIDFVYFLWLSEECKTLFKYSMLGKRENRIPGSIPVGGYSRIVIITELF